MWAWLDHVHRAQQLQSPMGCLVTAVQSIAKANVMHPYLIKSSASWPTEDPSKSKDQPTSSKRKFDDKQYDKNNRQRLFQRSWLGKFPWLGADQMIRGGGAMQSFFFFFYS